MMDVARIGNMTLPGPYGKDCGLRRWPRVVTNVNTFP